MRARIKNYLSITKKEWNGLVILITLIAMVIAAPYVYQSFHKDTTINFKDFDKAIAQLRKAGFRAPDTGATSITSVKSANPVMFPFNPNGLSVIQWKQLGLSGRQASIIKHYEEKGGRFYRKEDVKKIYGITDADYKRLEPYIRIPEANAAFTPKAKLKTGEIIELNTADSAKLTELPGIGGGHAVQIIRYRTRLGGFYNKEQLKEVYGIDSTAYEAIKNSVSVNRHQIKKIDINTISFAQLRLFPYLNYKQANAVIEYRNQHGKYTGIADMKNIVLLDDKILSKIEPYFNFK